MSWVAIGVEDVKSRLIAAEVAALEATGVEAGQADPIQEAIDMVTDEVMGYVESAGLWEMPASASVPGRLKLAAMDRIRYVLLSRFPDSSLLTTERVEANNKAVELLGRVADGKFALGETMAAGASGGGWGSATKI